MNGDFEQPKDMQPGKFFVRKGSESKPAPEQKEPVPETSERLVQYLSVFRDTFHPKADVIYYPACATDSSVSKAFPQSRVIYVDIDKDAVAALQKAGFEAYNVSALTFKPDAPADVLLLLNPSIRAEKPLETVQDGYVLCNDYHGTATEVKAHSDYELVGISRVQHRQVVMDRERLGDYWEEVSTEEEFKNARPGFGGVDYRTASRVVERLTGKTENILEEYKRIITLARTQTREKQEALSQTDPELAKMNVYDEKAELLQYRIGDEDVLIDTRLPRKKGTVDDLFVFKKAAGKK